MRIGSDALKLPGSSTLTPAEQLHQASEHGLEGLFFRTMLHMTPKLDMGILREARAEADAQGMYLESGLGKVNPYGLPETPEVRAAGDGDTLLGFRRIMEAAAEIGITELWVATAGIKGYPGRFAYDRFRTDVAWADQLVAIEKLLKTLAPIARDLDIHLNAETHEEITSFELVRLIDAVGDDVLGITFDTANMLQRAEHPLMTAERIAPFVRQSHVKDAALFHGKDGVHFQMRPVGEGVVDFGTIVPMLHAHNPNQNLSLEIRSAPEPTVSAPPVRQALDEITTGIQLYDPAWLAGHPDLNATEFAAYFKLIQDYDDRVARGERMSFLDYRYAPYDVDSAWAWVDASVAHLRSVMPATTTGIS